MSNIRYADLCQIIFEYLSQSFSLLLGKTQIKSGTFTEKDKQLHQQFSEQIETKIEDVQYVEFLFFDPQRCVFNCELIKKNDDGSKVFVDSNNSVAGSGWVSIDSPRLQVSNTNFQHFN